MAEGFKGQPQQQQQQPPVVITDDECDAILQGKHPLSGTRDGLIAVQNWRAAREGRLKQGNTR